MAEKSPVHSDHIHCVNCSKIKETHCDELKKSLEECAQAQEAARLEKEQTVQKELKEAKNKITKLQKTLSAFQLATTVGVTILGQETFNKIFSKVEEIQKVQAKITESIPQSEDKKDKNIAPKEPKKIGRIFNYDETETAFSRFIQKFSPLNPISTAKIEVTKNDTPEQPWIPDKTKLDIGNGKSEIIVDPPPTPPIIITSTTNYDFPVVVAAVPESILPIKYPLLAFQDSPFAFGQMSSVPEPNSLSVFALSLINTPRRRTV